MGKEHLAPVLFLDGGLGTSLEDKYGVKFDENTPLWSSHPLIDDPETLRACQRDFGSVPVDILLTATYQVSAESFSRTKTSNHPQGIGRSDISPFLDLAISIAEEVKAPDAHVALSVGPYGACMVPSQEYSGKYDTEHDSFERLFNWHRDRFDLFEQVDHLGSRISFIAFETVPRLDEIKAIRRLFTRAPSSISNALSLLHGEVPFWISCVFPGDAYTLPDGSDIDQVVDALLSTEYSDVIPWGIGINCTKIGKLPGLVEMYGRSIAKLTSSGRLGTHPISLVLYPDGTNGEIYDTVTKTWQAPASHQTPTTQSPWEHQLSEVVSLAQKQHCWRSIVVGGCCKATHSDITRLRAVVQET
ncbi:Homocysteine S-methyltransferase [Annulohypoxylon maeteangense]|uniref:Homocysteine S-methyltransferase n=1 Tax=Annulohypoxylon maeteangense TaxID=1927788 RepID=UPI0020080416|nr:Homocysteine S-methyltransferase [Annulohypoxylon maeteangense]KAI0880353.1 Homocysteine S-methyltransferase [Annulohypoxylon maeteangense]